MGKLLTITDYPLPLPGSMSIKLLGIRITNKKPPAPSQGLTSGCIYHFFLHRESHRIRKNYSGILKDGRITGNQAIAGIIEQP